MGEVDEKEGEEGKREEGGGRWRAEEHLQSCMQIKEE